MGTPVDQLPAHIQQQIRNQEADHLPVRLGNFKAKARPKTRKDERGMNGLEQRYADYLDNLKRLGDIAHWQFQPWTLNYAPGATYKFDFLVMLPDGSLEVHETKGHWEPAARVKVKTCAKEFWYLTFYAVTEKNGTWNYERFHPYQKPKKITE